MKNLRKNKASLTPLKDLKNGIKNFKTWIEENKLLVSIIIFNKNLKGSKPPVSWAGGLEGLK
jgi:hypothetical protein